jgi:hypothetical protein
MRWAFSLADYEVPTEGVVRVNPGFRDRSRSVNGVIVDDDDLEPPTVQCLLIQSF